VKKYKKNIFIHLMNNLERTGYGLQVSIIPMTDQNINTANKGFDKQLKLLDKKVCGGVIWVLASWRKDNYVMAFSYILGEMVQIDKKLVEKMTFVCGNTGEAFLVKDNFEVTTFESLAKLASGTQSALNANMFVSTQTLEMFVERIVDLHGRQNIFINIPTIGWSFGADNFDKFQEAMAVANDENYQEVIVLHVFKNTATNYERDVVMFFMSNGVVNELTIEEAISSYSKDSETGESIEPPEYYNFTSFDAVTAAAPIATH